MAALTNCNDACEIQRVTKGTYLTAARSAFVLALCYHSKLGSGWEEGGNILRFFGYGLQMWESEGGVVSGGVYFSERDAGRGDWHALAASVPEG